MEKKIIYGIVVNGKVMYVGSTTNGYRRYKEHLSRINQPKARPMKLYDGLRSIKDGESWDLVAFETCPTEKEFECETKWIEIHKPAWNDKEYGGSGRAKGCSNPTGSDHYLYGKKVSRHIVEASVAARIGKKLSDEHKAKLRAAHVGRPDQSVKIRCVETGEIFPSIAQAAKIKSLSSTSLLRHLNKKSGHCGGLHFERI